MNSVKLLILRVLRIYTNQVLSENQILEAIIELQRREGKRSNIDKRMIIRSCSALMSNGFIFSAFLGDQAPPELRTVQHYGITDEGKDHINKVHPLFEVIN